MRTNRLSGSYPLGTSSGVSFCSIQSVHRPHLVHEVIAESARELLSDPVGQAEGGSVLQNYKWDCITLAHENILHLTVLTFYTDLEKYSTHL